MPKKKNYKRARRSKDKANDPENTFWPLSGAIGMIITGLFLLLGGFGTGGTLPITMFKAVYTALGWAAYLSPVALIYFGTHKFISDDRQIPLNKLISMLAVLLLWAAWLHTAFVSSVDSGFGGSVGRIAGNSALSLIDKIPAAILFFTTGLLALFWSFGISPRILINLFKPFKEQADTDLTDLKQRPDRGFKMNEGVPIERTETPTSLKQAAQKLTGTSTLEALTVPTDPDWVYPSLDLLNQKQEKADPGDVEANALSIAETFANFSINVEMEGANIGPRLTQYTLKPPNGVKLTKMTALENNLALDLAAHSIRMEAPIPGKRLVGIEVPNVKPATVTGHSLMTSQPWQDIKAPLSFAIGKDITGTPMVGDLSSMPHLLIAGQTNSGKSVMINMLLTSLLYRNSPSDLKLILVDPKLVELSTYNDIPHLLTPVITEPEKCVSALKWAVAEMERRLRTMSEFNRSNITEYNALKQEQSMPYIVIVIDELADLMLAAARDVEALVVRLAQKARATGIHLALATQRPSVDVITGLIKANVPARIAFTVVSQIDSRVVIDQTGAEKLLGKGDMLFITADMPKPKRVQGAFVGKDEIIRVTDFLRGQRPPQYDVDVISQPVNLTGRGGKVADYGGQDIDDDLWRDAVKVVIEGRKASTSLLQRRLRVGYARAARLVESMEEQGIVGPADGSRAREVLVSSMDEVFGENTKETQETEPAETEVA